MALFASKQTFFKLLELAGEGLNSFVYKALRSDASGVITQTVALKILKSKENILFWRQEVESLLKVNSNYCVKVLDFEWVDDQPAMVLEWLDGITLARLFETGEIPMELGREILLQIQEGLIDLHMAGLCHGDLHMQNVFITQDGQVKLIDFGMANVSRSRFQGAPNTMAPEVLSRKRSPSFWSDLYSLGVIGEEMGVDCSELTVLDPEKRDLLRGSKDFRKNPELAEKVRLSLQKERWLKEQQTQAAKPLQKSGVRSFLARLFCLLVLFILIPESSRTVALSGPCQILVRTTRWHQLSFNGRMPRDSPTAFEVSSCGSVDIHWKNSTGSGELHLELRNGEFLMLTDADFQLDHSLTH